jgi:hypothetical protein
MRGVTQTITVNEVGRSLISTLANGIVYVSTVGAYHSCQRIRISIGVGEDVGLLHQFT